MIVVLDTEALFGDYSLALAAALAKELSSRGDSLIIPAVVLDEIENQFENQIEKTMKEVEQVNRSLGKIKAFVHPSFSFPNLDKSQMLIERKKHVEAILNESEIIEQEYPKLQTLVKRGRRFQKPFYMTKRDGRDVEAGYRDAAIWQTVVDIAILNPTEEIVFVSGNTSDFADPDNTDTRSLHSDLLDHIKESSVTAKIRYLTRLTDLEREYFYDKTVILTLDEAKHYHPEAFENFDANLIGALQDTHLIYELDIHGIINNSEIIEINNVVVDSCEKTWGQETDQPSSIKFSLELEVSARVRGLTYLEDLHVFGDGYYNLIETIGVLDFHDYNNLLARVEFLADISLGLNILFDNKSKSARYSLSSINTVTPIKFAMRTDR
jgi:PIN domain